MILAHKVGIRKIIVWETTIKHVQGCCHREQINAVACWNEDVELQSGFRHALDVLIGEHENVEMPSQSIESPLWLM